MQIDLEQFRAVFMEEAAEHLGVLERGLVRLEDFEGDPGELLDEIFRSAHSIKGGAGTFGLDEVSRLTHAMESVLDRLREHGTLPGPDQVDLLFTGVDQLRELLDGADDVPWTGTADALTATLEGAVEPPHAAPSPAAVGPAADEHGTRWCLSFRPNPDFFMIGADVVPLARELAGLGSIEVQVDAQALPSLEDLDPETSYLKWRFDLVTPEPESRIREVFEFVEDECELELERAENAAPAPVATAEVASEVADSPADDAPKPTALATRRDGGSIRVDTSKVDELVDLAGELVIAQARVTELVDRFSIDRLEELRQAMVTLNRSTQDLQEQVMRVRMVPLAHLFSRFPRLVRDIATGVGKKIRLDLSGEDTELDKSVIEQMSDPITHLLRNSADHGIESPEAREAAGKPAEGTIHIAASHQGGSVVLEIRDDGAGLNTAKIRAKAIENGLIGPDDDLSEEQIHALIFRPGFSTADQVSDLSGRGVGMDVVRRNVESFNGSITVTSVAGQGTCFRIRVPLTLAILDGQALRVGAQTFILPLLTVVESFQPSPDQVRRLHGRSDVILFRGNTTPLLHLGRLFGIPHVERGDDRRLVVVVETARGLLALAVDELLAQAAVVIKNLETNFRKIPGVMGATILGDGRVGLILDVDELDAQRRRGHGGRDGSDYTLADATADAVGAARSA